MSHRNPFLHIALGFPCQDDFLSVHQYIHHSAQGESCHDIEDGMLLDEHGGQDDGDGQDTRGNLEALLSLQLSAVDDGEMRAQGVVHMDAGPEVRGCIRLPQESHRLREDIVSGHLRKPQMMAVGPQGRDDQENRHAGEQEDAGTIALLFVPEEKEQYDGCHIEKPQKIRDDEQLTEGDVVIHAHMDYLVAFLVALLQPCEPYQVYDHIAYQRDAVSVFSIQALHFFHFTKPNLSLIRNCRKLAATASVGKSFETEGKGF